MLFSFNYPKEMYKGFSDGDYSAVFVQAKPFEEECKNVFKMLGINASRGYVEYIDKEKEYFYCKPTETRNELFLKSTSYKNQNEYRIILPDILLENSTKRFNIQLVGINPEDRLVSDEPILMRFRGKK